jgi:AraC-like DNA-binding protein
MKWCCPLILAFLLAYAAFAQNNVLVGNANTSQVDSLLTLAKNFQWIDSYKSLSYAEQAITISRNLRYQEGLAIANNLKGFCYWSFGDNDVAIEVALEALHLAEALHDPFLQAESYYILARGYMDLREQAKSDEYIGKAESLALQVNHWEQLCSIYNLHGVIKFVEGQRDSAYYYYTKALEIGRAHAVPSINFPRMLSNIGECYEDNPELAFKYFNEALVLARETSNRIAEASITDIIGHAYLRANDLKNAEQNLQAALVLARSLGLRRVIRHAYAGLVDIKLKQHRGDEAVVYLQQYYAVRDSLLGSSKIRQIVELESRHALQLKEQQVQLLEAENRIQTIWKNLMIGMVALLALLSTSVYILQRYRYRKNRDMLNLEIDYLTRQQQETLTKFKDQLVTDPDEALESHDQKLLKKAIAIVEHHISDSQFGVEGLAGELNMSRTNLHRKIKSITGFPPSELIRSIRLRKAAKLIARKVDSATQVALMVGFDDYSHFSKAFKKHFGVSPSGYLQHIETGEALHA